MWKWISENSAALMVIAALVAIVVDLTYLEMIPRFLKRLFHPDIILRVEFETAVLPPDLKQWLEEFHSVVYHYQWYKEKVPEYKKLIQEELARIPDDLENLSLRQGLTQFFDLSIVELQDELDKSLEGSIAESLKRIDETNLHLLLDQMTLKINNQSANEVSGLQLRIDDVLLFWNTEVRGTFIGPNDQAKIRDLVTEGYRDDTIVIPSLPSIPRNSSLEISLYGHLRSAKYTLDPGDYSMTEKYSVEVENNWLVDLYLRPRKFLILLLCALFVLWIIFEVWMAYFKERVVMEETKNILYHSACSAAQQGQADDAMVLLRQAIASGYSNLEHAKNDSDLRALHGRADFEALLDPDEHKT